MLNRATRHSYIQTDDNITIHCGDKNIKAPVTDFASQYPEAGETLHGLQRFRQTASD
jgi:hypothetical protein